MIGRLAAEGRHLPNLHLLFRPFVHREAVYSISGTKSDASKKSSTIYLSQAGVFKRASISASTQPCVPWSGWLQKAFWSKSAPLNKIVCFVQKISRNLGETAQNSRRRRRAFTGFCPVENV